MLHRTVPIVVGVPAWLVWELELEGDVVMGSVCQNVRWWSPLLPVQQCLPTPYLTCDLSLVSDKWATDCEAD